MKNERTENILNHKEFSNTEQNYTVYFTQIYVLFLVNKLSMTDTNYISSHTVTIKIYPDIVTCGLFQGYSAIKSYHLCPFYLPFDSFRQQLFQNFRSSFKFCLNRRIQTYDSTSLQVINLQYPVAIHPTHRKCPQFVLRYVLFTDISS